MDLLKRFVEYLKKINASKATIKNYRADVGQFIKWVENEFNKPFNPKDITPQLIDVYKKSNSQDFFPSSHRKVSPRSLKRHLSSLRKFFHFLKIEGTISKSPLDAISNSLKTESSKKDKWHLSRFRNYLYVYNLSSLTIKNYIIDVKQFFGWLEKITGINNAWNVREKNVFEKLNLLLINEYKERLLTLRSLTHLGEMALSPKTINRKLSSLRKYLTFAEEQGLIKTDQLSLQIKNEKLEGRTIQPLHDLLRNTGFISPSSKILKSKTLNHQDLVKDQASRVSTIKYSHFPPLRLLQKTTNGIIFVFDSLLVLPLASAIEQINYLFWKTKGKPVFKEISNKQSAEQTPKHRIKNYPKSFYAPLSISTAYFPLHKKVWHHLRYTRPKWYKKYHVYPIVHYFHFAILVILMSAIGFGLYNDFIFTAQNKNVLSALDIDNPRILAFKARLTDSLDNPITSPNTPLRVIIYNDPVASSSALLWQEALIVNPDSNGIFLSTLGSNEPIPQDIFSKNSSLWLGISIREEAELIPRQEIATVSLAVNAQNLQGLPPITSLDATTSNVILALDSSGNLNIGGSATPVFQATGGQFTLSGKVLFLTTVFGSETDVAISPDGLGKIDLQKPLQNTSNNNNIPTAIGALEVDDLFAVLATSSAQSAVTINQDGTGPIITASTSGTAKFTVENSGNIISAKGANWQPTLDSINGLNIASSSGIPFVTFDTLHQSVGIGTVIPETKLDVFGNFRASGDITLSKFVSNGGILYATKSGSLAQVNAGTTTQCLMGGETPKFANCQASPYNNITEENGNIGIGITTPLFKLDIKDSQSASAAAQIFNTNPGIDADGLIVKLGNTSTSAVSSSNHFISFETSGIGIVGSVRGDGAKGVDFRTSGIADFAEYLKKDETRIIEYGSLICVDQKGLVIPCDQTATQIIGVASSHGGFTGGSDLGENSIRVGFVGQIYTRVSTINGTIRPGDPLTSSLTPGVAVKATKAGTIVGRAMEEFTNDGIGKILVSVNVSWYDPDVYLTDTGMLSITQNTQNANVSDNQSLRLSDTPTSSDSASFLSFTKLSLADSFGQAIERIGAFAEIAVANLKVGLVKAEQITTNSFNVTTESVTVAGKNLKDYIVSVVNDPTIQQFNNLNNQKIISPIAEIDQIHTNIISPLASDSLRIHLGGVRQDTSQVILENASGSAVVTIDSFGNASFSGTLASSDLDVDKDATVGGTLRANRILAESIEGLETKVSTLTAQYIQNTQIASVSENQNIRSSDRSDDGTIAPIGSDSSSFLSFPNSLNVGFGTFIQGLMSLGPTSLAETAIAGNLSIQGTLILAANSINVLGNDLEIQPLRQGGISFLSGLIYIDTKGNLKVEGDAEFAKDVKVGRVLSANILSPIPESDLIIHLGGSSPSADGHDSSEVKASEKLIVENASGSAVLSINQSGDLVASGSGTFNKLSLNIVQPAFAISSTELIATGSAGAAAIKTHQKELTIKNTAVTDKSLIFITPLATPSPYVPFLIRQVPQESFTVGIQNPTETPVPFNWLIIN